MDINDMNESFNSVFLVAVVRFMICIVFCLMANYTDAKCLKIPNKLTFALLCTGLIFNVASGMLFEGCEAVFKITAEWLAGLLPAFVLLPFYALRMIGAGDIKFFSALGAFTGWKYSFVIIAGSFIASGIIGVFVLMYRGILKVRFKVMARYLKMCIFTRSVLPYDAAEQPGEVKGRFAFSYGITIGTAAAALLYYKINIV